MSVSEEEELDTILTEVFSAWETQSIRSIAREIGISPTQLSNLMYGATPHRSTRGKLRAWWARRAVSLVGASPT